MGIAKAPFGNSSIWDNVILQNYDLNHLRHVHINISNGYHGTAANTPIIFNVATGVSIMKKGENNEGNKFATNPLYTFRDVYEKNACGLTAD